MLAFLSMIKGYFVPDNTQRRKKILAVLVVMLLTGCQAGQSPLPTLAAAATQTTLPTQTAIPRPSPTNTAPPTAAATNTVTPTLTPTPLPGLGVETSAAVEVLKDFFTFSQVNPIEGYTVQKGISESGFTTIRLAGEPYLAGAELVMDISKEAEPASLAYWITFLESTTGSGKDAADWVQEHFREAAKYGQAEQVFGNARVILQVSGANSQILTIKVQPAD
jgi:hypothetical protein